MTPRISLCLIVKNEEANLRSCLQPIAGLVDEMVIVDTGSRDRTRAIAQEMGARVFDFPWVDDFSAARNDMLRHARGEWIFWLDADDRVQGGHLQKLGNLLRNLPADNHAFLMNIVSANRDPLDPTALLPQARLFRAHSQVAWKYRVHEQIIPSLQRLHYSLNFTDIEIHHVGYLDEALVHRKTNRDLRLLQMDYLTHPDDPSVLLHLAQAYQKRGDHSQAVFYLLNMLQKFHQPTDWGRMMYHLLVHSLKQLQRSGDALTICEQGLEIFPDDLKLMLEHGLLLILAGRLGPAEPILRRLLTTVPPQTFSGQINPVDLRLEGRRLLSYIYTQWNQLDKAVEMLQDLLKDKPDFSQGWVSLADIYVTRNDRRNAEFALTQLTKCPEGSALAKVLRAKIHILDQEFTPAEELLHQAIAESPKLVYPRFILAEWHLLKGEDVDRCINAYRDLLRFEPGHTVAQERLAWLESVKQARGRQQNLWATVDVGPGTASQ